MGIPERDNTDITPEEVGEGKYIEGETLAYVWDIINQNPKGPASSALREERTRLWSEVSYFEPPS
jgi:hypothetical protein